MRPGILLHQGWRCAVTPCRPSRSLAASPSAAAVADTALTEQTAAAAAVSAAHHVCLSVLQVPIKDHVAAMETVMDFLSKHVSSSIMKEVVAVGHRWAGIRPARGLAGAVSQRV